MTRLQRILLRQSELRTELASLLDMETRSEEQEERRESIVTELRGIERDIRDARMVEPETREEETETGDPAAAELIELRSRFRIGRVLGGHLGRNAIDGVEAEYCAERDVPLGDVPVDVFERRNAAVGSGLAFADGSPAGGIETRAVSPSTALSGVGTVQAPIVPAIFARSIAAFLGIDMPSAGVGDQAYPVLSSNLTADVKAKDAAGPETAADVSITSAEPRGITGAFRFRLEDAARLAGLEDALRQNLSDVLSDQVDNQALNGSGTGDGKINGLLNRLGAATAPAKAEFVWADWNNLFADSVDGIFSVDMEGVRALVGEESFRLAAKAFRANESNESAAAYLARIAGGLRASTRLPAPDSSTKLQSGVVRRMNPAGDRVAVMPVWDSIQIRDVYSGASNRQVVVTASMLVGDVVVLRTQAFRHVAIRTATIS